jgi:hypothetical protein
MQLQGVALECGLRRFQTVHPLRGEPPPAKRSRAVSVLKFESWQSVVGLVVIKQTQRLSREMPREEIPLCINTP